ncbi:MAG: hypothetical protein KBB94_08255 [Legionellaceae bacterium]|nr:hypothetical protein [Legionellaceae bacterium]MBP9775622.1 hypothetical protein [Legionellaceae bacterium]
MLTLKRYPVSISGLALALASIGSSWELMLRGIGSFIHVILLVISLALSLPVWAKILMYPKQLQDAIKDPVMVTALPTLTMLGMLYSDIVAYSNITLATLVLSIMLILHLILLINFIYYHIIKSNLEDYTPAWFIPTVGGGLACSAMAPMGYAEVSYTILCVASILFFVVLLAILLRFFIYGKVGHYKSPTLVVFAAPASICLSGYLSISNHPSTIITLFLASLVLLLVLFSYMLAFFIILKNKFSPLFSCLTFPLAMSTFAIHKFSQWANQQISAAWGDVFSIMSGVQLVASSAVIAYVLWGYCYYLLSDAPQKSEL